MTSIVDQANAEADAAEAEFPDEEAEEEIEADDESETEEPEASGAAMTEKQRERIIDKLDRENDRHTKRVAEVLGSDVSDLAPCPLCWEHAQGYILVGVMVDEVTAAMTRQVLGIEEEPEFLPNPEFVTCQTCAGLGHVLSGSRVRDQITVPCPKCTSKGFERVPIAWTPPPAPALAAVPQPGPDWSQLPPGPADQWGRPAGHPHFGMDPAKIGMVS